MKKIALISVSDKTGIDSIASELSKMGYDIISTGGTAKHLISKGIKIIPISEFTKFEEILEGRVKTLHPIIHAGILAKSKKDIEDLRDSKYSLIDVVIVNLYPFEKTISKKDCTFGNAIENIDIGGPTLLRASAKNHDRVTVLTDPSDYDLVLEEISKNGKVRSSTRLKLAAKVFSKVSKYDSLISSYLNSKLIKAEDFMQEEISRTLIREPNYIKYLNLHCLLLIIINFQGKHFLLTIL